ncbi:response regulator [Paenibacillaceae bacterium WGS1546]|uniref:response regulator n=1 Tax=Cohnella sp. WGS1546 TaxID=3366810 RepID=UPI00372D2B5C
MLRAILVDDEEKNLALMQKVIDWRECGFEIVGTAHNGEAGLDLFFRVLPDLAIVDVRMPIVNGIEMIRRIKEKQPAARVIILSAYGEFEYAQQAIEYGIDAYLLKPINEHKLMAKLEAIKGTLTSQRKERDVQALQQYIEAKPSADDEKEQGRLKVLAQSYSLASYAVVRIRCAAVPEEIASAVHPSFLVLTKNERESLVAFYSSVGAAPVEAPRLAELLKVRKESVRINSGHSLACGISRVFQSLADIREAVRQADLALSLSFYDNREDVVVYEPELEFRTLAEHELGKPDWQLSEALQAGKFPVVLEHLERVLEHGRKRRIHVADLHRFCSRILQLFVEVFGRMDCREGEQYLAPYTAEYVRGIASFEELKKFMLQVAMHAGGMINEMLHSNRNFSVIRKAKEYALLHFHEEDFSIQKVSEHVGLSRNHFSRLFKDNTGDNYWEYVIRLRMEEAKRQLRQTNRTNYEIAASIGYSSEYHFCRIFAKVEGVTTSQYRKTSSP